MTDADHCRGHAGICQDPPTRRARPDLAGQTVVVIGGSAGIGLETARRARGPGRRHHPRRAQCRAACSAPPASSARVSTAAFDATDWAALDAVLRRLARPIDHVLVTGPGPYYAPLAELDRDRAHRDFDDHNG